jgi:hypothetical protein
MFLSSDNKTPKCYTLPPGISLNSMINIPYNRVYVLSL